MILNDKPYKNIQELCFDKSADISIIEHKKIEYVNTPCAFDIETTSFYEGDEKRAIMYEWTFGINGGCVYGRTWEEFLKCIEFVKLYFGISETRHLVVYVHNLSYEFGFMQHYFDWEEVFCADNHKPIYAITKCGIEFRCSYLLSGKSLASVGNELKHYKVAKLVGSLDYELNRTSESYLSEEELQYCINDVLVVMSYIYDEIVRNGNIAKIPLTKTGYVRRYVRDNCFGEYRSSQWYKYHDLMQKLKITNKDEYLQLKRAFQGGFTHCNPFYAGKTQHNVASFDFSSDYPAQIVAHTFPMSRGVLVNIDSLSKAREYMTKYCCLFDVRFTNLQPKIIYENYISYSRCWGSDKEKKEEGFVCSNGRVVSCKGKLTITLTEQDFFIIDRFYKWDKIEISKFRVYNRGYLPTNFVKSVLELYKQKTELKGLKGCDENGELYSDKMLWVKGLLNATYGMMVTDPVRPEITYTDKWEIEPPNLDEAIKEYNESETRFTFYAWGVWVTAYARSALFTGIMEFGHDYVYSDTDSIKAINYEKHLGYINRYNDSMRTKLYRACDFHNLSYDYVEPSNIKGEKKLLGVWDFEGIYSRAKFLHAKCYMTEHEDEILITVAGLNKRITTPWLIEQYGKDEIFNEFCDMLEVPAEYTGKLCHTYFDTKEINGTLIDYMGKMGTYHEKSYIHMEKTTYSLSLSRDFRKYLDYINHGGKIIGE